MASPGNQHCVSCIGTLSFPTAVALLRADRVLGKRIAYKNGVVSVCPSVPPWRSARGSSKVRDNSQEVLRRRTLHIVACLMGLLQLRYEHDSSTIRARFGYNTVKHATTRYEVFLCARIRD